MATRDGSGGIRLASSNSPSPKNLQLDAKILEIAPVEAELWPILFHISLPWQQGLVKGKRKKWESRRKGLLHDKGKERKEVMTVCQR